MRPRLTATRAAPPAPQAIIVAYSQLRAAMYEGSTVGSAPLQRLRYEARPRFVLLGAGGLGPGAPPAPAPPARAQLALHGRATGLPAMAADPACCLRGGVGGRGFPHGRPHCATCSRAVHAAFGATHAQLHPGPAPALPAAAGPDTELFLACDPLADPGEAASLASRLGMWLHARHDQLFSLG